MMEPTPKDIYERTIPAIRECVRTNPRTFSYYDVTQEAFRSCDNAHEFQAINRPYTVSSWGKHSVFSTVLYFDDDPTGMGFTGVEYEMITAKLNEQNQIRPFIRGREWGMWVKAWPIVSIHADRSEEADRNRERTLSIVVETIAAPIICNLMTKLMERPVEYRVVKGPRFARPDRNYHNVVTISLSKPIIQMVGEGHGGGWHNPEHDVRGHERHYKSGKIVWVEGHKRGDPSIPRKTTYRVVP